MHLCLFSLYLPAPAKKPYLLRQPAPAHSQRHKKITRKITRDAQLHFTRRKVVLRQSQERIGRQDSPGPGGPYCSILKEVLVAARGARVFEKGLCKQSRTRGCWPIKVPAQRHETPGPWVQTDQAQWTTQLKTESLVDFYRTSDSMKP